MVTDNDRDRTPISNEGRSSIKILKFGQNFEAGCWSRLWGWSLVGILRLKFGNDIRLKVGPDFEADFDQDLYKML